MLRCVETAFFLHNLCSFHEEFLVQGHDTNLAIPQSDDLPLLIEISFLYSRQEMVSAWFGR